FASPAFRLHEAKDQRQTLRLMIHAKGIPSPGTAPVLDAHRAAMAVLADLITQYSEPADHEMMGICHLALGDEKAAAGAFRAGLAIERERNAQSDLCGTLMKRVSML
ncbi:MAG: hypothetical protein ACREJ3_08725, partial [Polyangiaceae bacterium]